MKRVLSILSGNIESGGAETYLKNLYENINMERIQIDIIVPGHIVYEPYSETFKSLGCTLVVLNIPQENRGRYAQLRKRLVELLDKKQYYLMHVNTGNLTIQAICLSVAKKYQIKTISHSHGTLYPCGKIQGLIRNIMRNSVNRNADYKVACSKKAGESLFGVNHINEVIIAKNGIYLDKYGVDPVRREHLRKEMGINDYFVIGSVGRLSIEKNYSFVLRVFSEVLKRKTDSRLLIAGDGDQRDNLIAEAKALEIDDKVRLLGVRKDIPELLQCFDIFVLASKREALGIVNIEAQASSLYCIVSDAVPEEVNVTGKVKFLPLGNIEKWVDALLKYDSKDRQDCHATIKNAGYDLRDSLMPVIDLYRKEAERIGE